jgi:neutral ceramidase
MEAPQYNGHRLIKLPAKSLLIFVALLFGLAVAALGVLSLPWVKPHGGTPPRVGVIARGSGPLAAGVGVAPIDVPLGAPIAGFPHLSYRSDGADPITARALVLSAGSCRVALVSAEILLVPDSLRAAVLARLQGLGLSGVLLGATHTHASPGGYWENVGAERAGLGPYDPAMRDLVANAMAEAVRRALAAEGPARLSVARGRSTTIVRGRDGALPDGQLTALRLDRPDGQPIAELDVFASHATLLGIHNRRISGDWPSQLLARSKRGVRLLLQGAVGDQSTALPHSWGPMTVEAYAAAVDRAIEALTFGTPDPAPALAYASAEVTLPTPEPPIVPRPLRQAATNVVAGILPTQAHVSALRLGPVLLLGAPGEVLAPLAARWRELGGPGAEVVSLADGYLGYLDAPDKAVSAEPHPERSYYGQGLTPTLERGLELVVGAVQETEKPAARPAGPR